MQHMCCDEQLQEPKLNLKPQIDLKHVKSSFELANSGEMTLNIEDLKKRLEEQIGLKPIDNFTLTNEHIIEMYNHYEKMVIKVNPFLESDSTPIID